MPGASGAPFRGCPKTSYEFLPQCGNVPDTPALRAGEDVTERAVGWFIAIIGTVIAGMFGLGGFGSIPDHAGTFFCGALALLFVAALLVVAGRGSPRS